jgi:hypothetical protein
LISSMDSLARAMALFNMANKITQPRIINNDHANTKTLTRLLYQLGATGSIEVEAGASELSAVLSQLAIGKRLILSG